ncbi:MAG: phage tail protein [Balneolaceae bacterium]
MAVFHPPTGFHFSVRFENLGLKYPGIEDIGFQEVLGIHSEFGVEEYQEGGENRFTHRLPQPASFPNLVMKRGMLLDSQLVHWFRELVNNFQFDANDCTVILLNSDHEPLQAWNFINAWPVKWSVDGLHAEENKIMIESIEFAYQYYRRIDPTSIL